MLGQEPARPLPRQAALSPAAHSARRRTAVLLLVFVLAAGGCASAAEVTGVALQQDLQELRTDLFETRETARRAKTDVDALAARLERRAREQDAEAEQQSKALADRFDALTKSLTALKSRVDELAAGVEKLRAAMPPRPVVPPPPAAPAPPPPAPAGPPRPTTGALQPQDVYQAAYIDISKGSYSLAIAGFREFLRRYAEHDLAGNAQYWLGEAYLSLARGYASGDPDKVTDALNQAVLEFRKVLANYPRSEKAPTALYKEALALIELKQPQVAQQRLQYLLDNFPQAEEAPLARERLTALKK